MDNSDRPEFDDPKPGAPIWKRRASFKSAMALYFGLFALFALASWRWPADESMSSILTCAIFGSWVAVVLVWLFGDGPTDAAWLRLQIVGGVAADLAFNYGARLAGPHKALAAVATSVGNLGLLAAAIGAGLLVARGLLRPNYLVMAAIVGALTDIFSVYAGPTKHVISTEAFYFLSFAWGLVGRGGVDGVVGAGDFIFLALFFSGARRFGLDDRKTLGAMMAAIVAGFLSLLFTPAGIPALPFFAVSLLIVHGRELKAQMRG